VVVIRAHLRVNFQFDKDADGNARQEDWGEFDFAELPRKGELVDVIYDHSNQTVIVSNIIHFAVPNPRPETDFPSLERKEPVQHILADWHWSD